MGICSGAKNKNPESVYCFGFVMAFDVVCVGNATIDVFIQLKGEVQGCNLLLPVGAKKEIDSIFYSTGGGATNTAVGFKRLGLNTAVLAAVGKDFEGKIVLNELRKEKINTKLIARLPGFNTSYSAILTGFGADRIILTYGGATTHLGEERQVRWGMLSQAKWLHITSFHSKPHLLEKVLAFSEQKQVPVSFNPGMSEIKLGLQKLLPLLQRVDVLLLNRAEAAFLTRETKIEKILRKLQAIVPLVVVTEGRQGAHATNGAYYYFKPTYKVKIADTTGAGDAFHCGFVAAIIKGLPVEKAMSWGNANAQSVIMYLGAKNKLLSLHEIEAFIREHETNKTATVKREI